MAVIAEPGVQGEVAAEMDAVLHEACGEPLCEVVTIDAEIDWLRVVLDVGQGELIKGSGGGVLERKGAQDGGAGLATCSARVVTNQASAQAKVVNAMCPGQSIGQLNLVAVQVGGARLTDGEGH